MNEFSEHGPVRDPALGDEAEEPGLPEQGQEQETDAARGEVSEHPQAETPPN